MTETVKGACLLSRLTCLTTTTSKLTNPFPLKLTINITTSFGASANRVSVRKATIVHPEKVNDHVQQTLFLYCNNIWILLTRDSCERYCLCQLNKHFTQKRHSAWPIVLLAGVGPPDVRGRSVLGAHCTPNAPQGMFCQNVSSSRNACAPHAAPKAQTKNDKLLTSEFVFPSINRAHE